MARRLPTQTSRRKADETDDKFIKKKADEEKKIKQAAKEMGKVNTPSVPCSLACVAYACGDGQ
jgi:hypothetical protein